MTSILKFNQLTFCEGSGNKYWKYEEACLLTRAHRLQKTTITAAKTLQIPQSKVIVRENRFRKTGFRQLDSSTEAVETWNPVRAIFSQIQKAFQMFPTKLYMINTSNTQAEKPFYYLINQVAKHISLFSEVEEQVNWKKPLNITKKKEVFFVIIQQLNK